MSGGGKVALGGGGLAIVLFIVNIATGGKFSGVINMVQSALSGSSYAYESSGTSRELTAEEQQDEAFVKTIVADTEDIWGQIFQQSGLKYEEPRLVLYSGQTQTAGGTASAAMGPFYRPADKTVYLDMSFFEELRTEFGARIKSDVNEASGEFVVAYVIAHEIGHHVQNLLGTSSKVSQMEQRLSQAEGNKYSVALELQADFYAGVFAYYEEHINSAIEVGDIEAALSAASVIGDDAIQQRTQGTVRPDSFTHGTSAQRVYWFKKGYESGDPSQGDTFRELGLSF
jgi:predicted metalloprotease